MMAMNNAAISHGVVVYPMKRAGIYNLGGRECMVSYIKIFYEEGGAHLVLPNKYISDTINSCGVGLRGIMGIWEPKIDEIGHVSGEIERGYAGMTGNTCNGDGGLEKQMGRGFIDQCRQWDNKYRVWMNFGTCRCGG
jgi:hypothetical protein